MQESSPLIHIIPLAKSDKRVEALLQLTWDMAYSHGVKMTERAHAILDEPEYRITEQLKFPVLIDRTPQSSKKRRLDNLELPAIAKVIDLYNREPIRNVGNFRKK